MKNLRNEFPVKTTGEFTQSSQQGNRPLQSDRLEFRGEIVKILKELREDRNSNADSFRKELENIRRFQEKIEN